GPRSLPTWPRIETAAREPIARARYIRLESRVTSQSRTVSTAIAAKAAVVAYWLTVMNTPWLTVSRTFTEATNCSVSRCIAGSQWLDDPCAFDPRRPPGGRR